MPQKLIRDFFTIWVTIEPLGSLALFVTLTARMSAEARRKIALRAIAFSALILLGSIIIGQILLAGPCCFHRGLRRRLCVRGDSPHPTCSSLEEQAESEEADEE